MFFMIGLIFFILGCIPLAITVMLSGRTTPEKFKRSLRRSLYVVIVDVLIVIGFNVFGSIYTDVLWFKNIGYAQRFWTVLASRFALYGVGLLIAFVFLYVNLRIALKKMPQGKGLIALFASLLLALFLATSLSGLWEETLLFINRIPGDLSDPVFNKSVGFYLFSFPFLVNVAAWLLSLIIITVIAIFSGYFYGYARSASNVNDISSIDIKNLGGIGGHVFFLVSLLLGLLAFNSYLNIYRLMYSTEGVVTGVGYVDMHFRRLAHVIGIIVYGVLAVLTFVSSFSQGFRYAVFGLGKQQHPIRWGRLISIPLVAFVVLVTFIGIIPQIVKGVVVSPNEITLEEPYIKHNIAFTRRAYGIDEENIIKNQFSAGRNVTRSVINRNEASIENIRLWDPRALIDNLKEQQEIRLYYEFQDVDIDRYYFGGDYRQVMLSTRELSKNDLDPRSQTWVSRKFKYTHGYGLVLLPVHEFLPQGGPNLLIKNIPPRIEPEEFKIERPGIYYGEKTNDYIFVRTAQEEFHYPAGDENVYTTYEGGGGVDIGSFWKKVFYAWKFDDYRMLFSGYLNSKSRILFNRNIIQRVRKLAPFLVFDDDPYTVISEDGHLKYIIDAYTVSGSYPYSEKYRGSLRRFGGANYIRNSVKVVVDAYDGSVDFYVVNPDDILISAYDNVFPGLLKPFDKMPDNLQRHIRYPADLLVIQGEMYSTYHMQDPAVFYQREDVWEFATERYRENFQKVDPYFVMVDYPDKDGIVFSLIMPFTPRNKNVIHAWLAGICDLPNYGKLRVFTFPKGVEVIGPRQIEARIDQNTEMSQAMTLWGQRGSEVIRGNLLAIPLFGEEGLYLLYVEPIYLQAEDAQLPEIKRIVVADQERVVWAKSFDKALDKLVGAGGAKDTQTPTTKIPPSEDMPQRTEALSEQAAMQGN
ncbi:MAG: UPF0182 family protein [Chitinivibrionales bacterium]|nr:UPF0182 family protein [Chitinivibrionales bacterium]